LETGRRALGEGDLAEIIRVTRYVVTGEMAEPVPDASGTLTEPAAAEVEGAA
jgi:hypothetical protein